jgi:hypothetical protein
MDPFQETATAFDNSGSACSGKYNAGPENTRLLMAQARRIPAPLTPGEIT